MQHLYVVSYTEDKFVVVLLWHDAICLMETSNKMKQKMVKLPRDVYIEVLQY